MGCPAKHTLQEVWNDLQKITQLWSYFLSLLYTCYVLETQDTHEVHMQKIP